MDGTTGGAHYRRPMSTPEIEVDEAAPGRRRRVPPGRAGTGGVGRRPLPLAIWIPLGELGARLDEVPTDRTVAVVCRSGGRSAAATEALRSTGIDAVNVAGGMKAWAAEGLPVVAADGLPGVVT